MMILKRIKKIISKLEKRKKRKADRKYRRHLLSNTVKTHFRDLIVKNGPFQGMKYPAASSSGSTLLPKLIGSYEAELNNVIERICAQDSYVHIIDIGCAEGYYAVGLALRLPKASVHAYDSDPVALASCRDMAAANQIDNKRFFLGDFCSTKVLMDFDFSGKAIIISDCEGFEKQLFTAELAERLKSHDLLIETHDVLDIEITTYLHSIFSKTHDIEIIFSIDDIQKAKTYQYEELNGFSLNDRRLLLAERRAAIGEWFYITSRE